MKFCLALALTMAVTAAVSAQDTMERVDGIGGFFFKSKSPEALAQ